MSKTFAGLNIREVWNFRLSTAAPVIDRRSGTWVVHIYAKNNPDYDPADPSTVAQPLESYDTGIPATPGDGYDAAKVAACYEWLYGVRDKYARPDIEELKPAVAKVEAANAALAEAQAQYNQQAGGGHDYPKNRRATKCADVHPHHATRRKCGNSGPFRR